MRRSRQILGSAYEECNSLRRSGAAKVAAELVPAFSFPGHVDKHQIVQVGPPPAPRFEDIRRAVHLDAELSHHIGPEIAFRLRGVQQEYTLLPGRNAIRRRKRQYD